MTTLFNFLPPIPEKPTCKHPWEGRVKDVYAKKLKYAHNSISSNPYYPKKNKEPNENKAPKIRFTVIGSQFSKEFIHCKHIVNKLYKYRSKVYDKPVVRGVTTVQWPEIYNKLKLKLGGLAYCLDHAVVVLLNNNLLGGYEELKEYFHKKYLYTYQRDDNVECVKEFTSFVNSTTRPFVYMHFSIDDKHVGTMIFMLYTDIVPQTCDNFMRLCCQTKGGYPGTPVHRIVKDCWIQIGGFGLKGTDMRCENFIVDFDKRGVLGMANADRHVDCSTQFFIISQPAHWMKHNYVAFGQLIDGDSTFKMIEEVPTWYESPTKDIRIERAGILNLECHDIAINKNAGAYIDGHIENLYEVGEMCIEMLLEKVFDKILLKYLKTLEEPIEEEASIIEAGEELGKGILAPVTSIISLRPLEAENKEFDVESYTPEEEYQYTDKIPESDSPVIKPDIPFYIPLTDVPYPDEDDSIFDFKKFLTGKYCLETDLQKGVQKKVYRSLRATLKPTLPVIDIYLESSSSDSSPMSSESQINMEQIKSTYNENICLPGSRIKQISKSRKISNIMDPKTINCALNDEEIRRSKHVTAFPQSRSRIISLCVPGNRTSKKLPRRPTGFIRDEDLQGLIGRISITASSDSDDDEDTDSDDDVIKMGKRRMHIDTGAYPKQHSYDYNASNKPRLSTMRRLWNELDIDDKDDPPTLKDYRLLNSELPGMRHNYLTMSQKIETVNSRDSIHHGSDHIAIGRELKKPLKTIATVDSFDVIPSGASRPNFKASLTSAEHYKRRPTITVNEYKNKNRQSRSIDKTGIRLPGDSPLYSSSGIHLLTEKTFDEMASQFQENLKVGTRF